MNIPTIFQLERILNLTKQKDVLKADLEKIEQQIVEFFSGGYTGAKAAPAARGPIRRKPRARRTAGRRGAYGSQKEKILAVLKEAGKEGLSVAEVAQRIGAKPVNISPWFYTAGKKAGVKKVARGRFALAGAAAAPASERTAKAVPAAPSGTRRSALAGKILALLEKAGDKGISVAEVAAKIGSKRPNVEMWFARTGKKVRGIVKIAPGRFAVGKAGAAPIASKAASAVNGATIKDKVLAVLKSAGKGGLSIAEVARKSGAKKSSLNVWFYTVGKKVKAIKKVGRGRFGLK